MYVRITQNNIIFPTHLQKERGGRNRGNALDTNFSGLYLCFLGQTYLRSWLDKAITNYD